jgi:hypothetical protein
MCLSRCSNCGKPKGKKRNYVGSAYPIGHPNGAVLCGTEGCNFPGIIWLTETEFSKYQRGERIFELPTHTVKVRVI